MGLTLDEELRRTFERATLRREARHLKTPEHWAQAKELMIRAEAARDRETKMFRERFHMRVEAVRRRLIDEAGGLNLAAQPRWAGIDRFDPAALFRQAQRVVRTHHEARLTRIDEAETLALAYLVHQAERENALMGSLVRAFGRAAHRNQDGAQFRRMRSKP